MKCAWILYRTLKAGTHSPFLPHAAVRGEVSEQHYTNSGGRSEEAKEALLLKANINLKHIIKLCIFNKHFDEA